MLGDNEDSESFAGCTANVCLITQKTLYVANCGDSRSIIKTGNVSFLLRRQWPFQ